jgi:mycofactocin system creatininase family protein
MSSLSQLSWPDVEARSAAVLVVPVGATEQHGPHLPLTTDSDIAEELAARLAATHPSSVTIAPLVAFGSSGEHQGFAGTLSIGRHALMALLVELGRSATCSWSRVLFLSTHGGNLEVVTQARDQLRDEGRDVRAWFPDWSGDAHAGRTETALMLAIAPGRVDRDAAAPGAREPLAQLLPQLMRDGVAAVSPNGVLGDPAGASAAEGEVQLSAAVHALCALLDAWTAASTTVDVTVKISADA